MLFSNSLLAACLAAVGTSAVLPRQYTEVDADSLSCQASHEAHDLSAQTNPQNDAGHSLSPQTYSELDPGYSLRCLDSSDLKCSSGPSPLLTNLPGTFNITNFDFGCTAGCFWYLDVSVELNPGNASTSQHPGFSVPVHIQGSLDDDTTYVVNNTAGPNQSAGAYIIKASNLLQLEYLVTIPDANNPNGGATYNYTAAIEVYSATGDQAALQQPNFRVEEQLASGAA
ncbi:hypothetical protein BST61_g6514 [Cercospora zeina]